MILVEKHITVTFVLGSLIHLVITNWDNITFTNKEKTSKFRICRDPKLASFFSAVQPNSPKIVKCEEVGQNLKVTIEPPSNWSTPHSFFSLEHQIQYRLIDNNQVDAFLHQNIILRISFLKLGFLL